MKTAAKVFIIISMVFGFWLIYPIILGSFAIKKLNTATKTEDLTVLAILVLIFMSILGGVFMLLVSDEELAENAPAKHEVQAEPAKIEDPAPVEEPQEENKDNE